MCGALLKLCNYKKKKRERKKEGKRKKEMYPTSEGIVRKHKSQKFFEAASSHACR